MLGMLCRDASRACCPRVARCTAWPPGCCVECSVSIGMTRSIPSLFQLLFCHRHPVSNEGARQAFSTPLLTANASVLLDSF